MGLTFTAPDGSGHDAYGQEDGRTRHACARCGEMFLDTKMRDHSAGGSFLLYKGLKEAHRVCGECRDKLEDIEASAMFGGSGRIVHVNPR